MKLILLYFVVLTAASGYAQCTGIGTDLATSYVSNNSNKGEMFNIVATNTVTLLCFDLNLIPASNGSYEIYYKAGSYIGSENNAAAWTLIGSNPMVPCIGFDVPSPIDIPVNIVIPAGQTYGFYITATNPAQSAGIRYTNNGGYTTIASDADISIAGGIGKSYPFGTNYGNRSFNGTVHYTAGNILPVEMSDFSVTNTGDRVLVLWQTQSELNNDYFTVQRSADSETWETIGTVYGAGTSVTINRYTLIDEAPMNGISYYRLAQTDTDGQTKFFEIRSLNREQPEELSLLIAFPNPATDVITLKGSPDELGEIGIYSVLGQNLLPEVIVTQGHSFSTIDLSGLPPELIVIRAGDRSALVVKR